MAAIIHAAVDECVYWTYQEDTTDLSASSWFTLLGTAVLGTGVYGIVNNHWPSNLTGALTGAGAGVTLAQNLLKVAPTPVQASVSSVLQSGLSYYTLLKAKATLLGTNMSDSQKEAALSGLWDAAGAGCSPGVLKGFSDRTKHATGPDAIEIGTRIVRISVQSGAHSGDLLGPQFWRPAGEPDGVGFAARQGWIEALPGNTYRLTAEGIDGLDAAAKNGWVDKLPEYQYRLTSAGLAMGQPPN